MFVHTLLLKLQTKNGNRFEYVRNVILTERIQPGSNSRGAKTYRTFTDAGPSHSFIPIHE